MMIDTWKDIPFVKAKHRYQINQDKNIRVFKRFNNDYLIEEVIQHKITKKKFVVYIEDIDGSFMDFEVKKIYNYMFPPKTNKRRKPLNKEEVKGIKEDFSTGKYSMTDLSRKYAVSISSVSLVVNNITYQND